MDNIEEKPKRTRKKKSEDVEQETVTTEDAEATLQDAEPKAEDAPEETPEKALESRNEGDANGHAVKVVTSLLNVRKRPERTAEVIGLVKYGDILSVVDELDGDWFKLDGEGYVMAEYVKKVV